MNRSYFRAFTWLMWLSMPLTALHYWQLWDQLPARMATHFNAAGQPNGWMTREESLWFSMGLLAFLLVIFTVILYVQQKRSESELFSWALLAFSYVVVGLIFYVENALLDYNVTGSSINFPAFGIVLVLATLFLLAIYLGSRRGAPLPPGEVIAEEVHAGRPWAAVFLLPVVAEALVAVVTRNPNVMAALGVLCLVAIPAFGMAWSGFHYYFTRHGLEIRTLGFRLKSVPLAQIKQYAPEPWRRIRGCGIRGIGNRRAYVWGDKGVRIRTGEGEVFLGHNQPEKLVQDLDTMMKFART